MNTSFLAVMNFSKFKVEKTAEREALDINYPWLTYRGRVLYKFITYFISYLRTYLGKIIVQHKINQIIEGSSSMVLQLTVCIELVEVSYLFVGDHSKHRFASFLEPEVGC